MKTFQEHSRQEGKTARLAETIQEIVGSTIFSVCFVKRSDGKERTMLCRVGVRKGLKTHAEGEERTYDPIEHGLLRVWDFHRRGYRSIPLDGIKWIRVRGRTYSAETPLDTPTGSPARV